MIDFVRDLDDAGVRLLTGTDTINPFVVPGASLHEEIELFASAGMTPERALVCATRDAAASLGRPDLGRIQEGCMADLVILRRDPTEDLANLDSIEAVIAGGRLYRIAQLREDHDRARAMLESLLFRIANPLVARLAVAVLGALQRPKAPDFHAV